MSQPSATRRENGRLIALRKISVAQNQDTVGPGVSHTKKEIIKEMICLKQMSRTERGMLELRLNATINGLLIKPGEKGEQNLEGVDELFKFSLVLIVDQLPS